MAWHRLEHKQTGEVVVVASLDGMNMDEWDAVPVAANRAPTEFQVVHPDGTMTTDSAKQEEAEEKREAEQLGFKGIADKLDILQAKLDALDARIKS